MSPPMHRYHFGDKILACAFPLPSLRPAPATATASLHISAPTTVECLAEPDQSWHQWQNRHGDTLLRLAPGEPTNGRSEASRTYLLQFSGLCELRLDPAHGSIAITRLPGTDAAAIEHLLIDLALPCLLAELGELVVHAGCVTLGSGCVLFLGQSGWGKSTLTSLLRRHGHAPLSDDCMQLAVRGDQVLAMPTYPGLRLFDDSVEQTFEQTPAQSPVAHYTRKQRIRLEAHATHPEDPFPVRALYLLNDPAQPATDISIEPVSDPATCMALITHGFRLDLRSRRSHASFMQQAAETARRLPAFALRYPRDFAQAERLIAELTRHFAALPAPDDARATDAPPAREQR
ncbi:MAG: hypothetical protein QM769_04670 [Pseudoxanthomonas sp.]